MGNLIQIALNLQISLVVQSFLTMLILPIQEYGIFFHLFVSSWFLSSVSYTVQIMNLLSLQVGLFLGVSFFSSYFTIFDAVVNGIVSLISLSDLLLLAYKNAVDFCVLILYPATLPNSWMSSNSFLIASLLCSFWAAHPGGMRLLISHNHLSYHLDVASFLSSGVGYLF